MGMGLRDFFRSDTSAAPSVWRTPGRDSVSTAPRAQGAQWIPPGGSFLVGGQQIGGGLVYVGRGLPSATGFGVEPALIDPSLKVDWRRPDYAGRYMDYWPRYEAITPQSRAAYLAWLADGRSDPRVYIGYVFLFFYGLERRALLDAGLDLAQPDFATIVAEVRRLLELYGSNNSFCGYAAEFLELADARLALEAELSIPETLATGRPWELPFRMRVALGRFAAANAPVPPTWALAWLRSDPRSYLRTPATRCEREFDELFMLRYRERYGDGMVVRAPRREIAVDYRPASAGFSHRVELTIGNLPDVGVAEGPIEEVRELARECTDALDAYSRHLGRHPQGRGEPAAVALLPPELIERHGGRAVTAMKEWADEQIGVGSTAVVPIDHLVVHYGGDETEKLSKRDAVSIASLLGKLGVGIEPDVRFGGATPKPGTPVVLFRLDARAPATPSADYSAAALLVRLAAVLAAADGTVSEDERRHLAVHLEQVLGLDAWERVRLEAVLEWLGTQRVGLGGLKRRLQDRDPVERDAIAHFLVDVAAADGRVTPDEIAVLVKLHRLLGLDEADVYSRVHARGAGDPGPVTIQRADPDAVDRWAIPPERREPGPVELDLEKVAKRRAETAAVSALLSDIFVEDGETESAAVPSPATTAAAPVVGLDGPHANLVSALRAQPGWDRGAFEAAAEECGLPLLDAAIERINDAVIEMCGEPLIEGDDPLELNDYALQELT